MNNFAKIIGYLMWIGAGILMFIFWFIALSKWLGSLGIILALILSPGLAIFPIVFWIVEGVFSGFYFLIWGIGIIGLIITSMTSNNN